MLPINKQLININYSKGVTINPRYIVVHDTDNRNYGATALANRNYFANHPNAQASAHYVVDDESIIQCLEDTWRGWHIGDRYAGASPAVPDATNSNAIGIEITVNPDSDFNVAVKNAIDLTKHLMAKFNISVDRVIRHKDATGKTCPRMMIVDRPQMWIDFKNAIAGKDLELSQNVDRENLRGLVGVVNATALNVRDYHSTSASIIGTESKGHEFNLDFKQGDWISVYYGDHGGWVYAKYIDIKNSVSAGSSWVSKLQSECNNQGFSNQTVDGYPGKNTLDGCPMLKRGASGNITRILQERLNTLGYGTNGIDGIFGWGTFNAVSSFQGDNGLRTDGVVGRNTWKVLLGL